jgi:lysophospholipase L1-like esterase
MTRHGIGCRRSPPRGGTLACLPVLRSFLKWSGAIVVYAGLCAVYTLTIVLVAAAAFVSIGALAYVSCTVWLVGVGSPTAPARGVVRWIRSAGALLVMVGFFVAGFTREVLVVPLALVAALLIRSVCRFVARVLGQASRHVGLETAVWVAALLAAGLLADGASIVVVFAALLWRHDALLRALARGPVHWTPLVLSVVAALLIANASRGTLHARIKECRPGTPFLGESEPAAPVWIATLGDSSTQPVFVPEGLGYATRLERLLQESTARYHVVNCSFAGASSYQLAGQLERALAFHPTIVTIYIGNNDRIGMRGRSFDPVMERYRQNVYAVIERCRHEGIRPILVTSPTGIVWPVDFHHALQQANFELGREQRVEVVDAAGDMRSHWFFPLFFTWDFIHPNRMGHDRIARMLALQIRSGEPPSPAAP